MPENTDQPGPIMDIPWRPGGTVGRDPWREACPDITAAELAALATLLSREPNHLRRMLATYRAGRAAAPAVDTVHLVQVDRSFDNLHAFAREEDAQAYVGAQTWNCEVGSTHVHDAASTATLIAALDTDEPDQTIPGGTS